MEITYGHVDKLVVFSLKFLHTNADSSGKKYSENEPTEQMNIVASILSNIP